MANTVGVGMLGLGTVGTAVARRLIGEWELLGERAGVTPVLRRVAVRDASKTRDVDLKNAELCTDPFAVIDDAAITIVVEVMGGVDGTLPLIERALRAGKTVVTANKALMAAHGRALWRLAADQRAGLWFEAAVGAGLPIIGLLRDSLRGDRVQSIDSIINGTTNVILTRMRRHGSTLSEALTDAQARGFAEADPSADVDGWDAAQKLVLMARLAFDADIGLDDVVVMGIRDLDRVDMGYTGQLGYSVKLLAQARSDGGTLHLRVRPTLIPEGHDLFDVGDSDNAVRIRSDLAGTVLLRGLGAGGDSTASAVVSDVVNAVRRTGSQPAPPMSTRPHIQNADDVETAGYIRVRIGDGADAGALVVQALEDRGLDVQHVVEKPPIDGPFPQLLVLTGTAPRAVHRGALETLDTLAVVHEVACALDRLEEPA